MLTTYRLDADEMNEQIVNAIRQTYRHKRIEIIVQEVEDETEYLLRSDANREHLLESIAQAERGDNLIQVELDTL